MKRYARVTVEIEAEEECPISARMFGQLVEIHLQDKLARPIALNVRVVRAEDFDPERR